MYFTTSIVKLLLAYFCVGAQTQLIDDTLFENELRRFRDEGIGVSRLQRHYDNVGYSREPVVGLKLRNELTWKLGDKFRHLKDAVSEIKNVVESNYHSFSGNIGHTNMAECCVAEGLSDDLKFQTKISRFSACLTQSAKSAENKKFPDHAVEKVMINNSQSNPTLLWQYFGGEDGTSILFPKTQISSCTSFDPRYRPFYASAVTPTSKDVVVVIDTSSSMDKPVDSVGTLLDIAKEAATIVINTMNPNDRMAVVAFDDTAHVPVEPSLPCYSNVLSKYTEGNADIQTRFTKSRKAGGGSNYSAGLEEAFKYFHNSPPTLDGEERYQVILFLTDGTENPSDTSPLDVIRNENEKLGNRVFILTYGIGKDISTEDKSLLRNMSEQTQNHLTAGAIKKGFLVVLEDSSDLRSKMGTYYSFFRTNESIAKPIFSFPFLDTFSSSGLLISVCLPAYNSGVLIGVACSDIKLSDLFLEISVFHEGDLSYIFIIDKHGHTLKHPLLPVTVQYTYSLLDISLLERARGTEEVIKRMKRGENGSVTIESSVRTMARGVVLNQGILTRSVESTYHFAPIPYSDYSLCVVVGEGAENSSFSQQIATPDVFVYHRRDIAPDSRRNCKNFDRLATTDGSIVKFNVNAFLDPAEYLYGKETMETVQKYTEYFTGVVENNSVFKPQVYNSIVVSHEAEKIWKSNQDISLYVIWRYYGTRDGFVRVYPGVTLSRDYDYSTRPWWRGSIAQRGNLFLTTPYVDRWGAGWVVSMCHSIYVGKQDGIHTKLDEVEGVICTDVGLSYLYNLILKVYGVCEETEHTCMLVDNSGFIVIHPEFVDPYIPDADRANTIENRHLVHKESDVAEDLINRGAMTKQSCVDFDNHKLQYTYRIYWDSLPEYRQTTFATGVKGMKIQMEVGEKNIVTPNYEIWELDDTNLFIIRKNRNSDYTLCCEQIPMISPDSKKCTNMACECLCYNPIEFNVCSDSSEKEGTSSTCIARTPDFNSINTPDVTDDLEECFDAQCQHRSSQFDCYGVAGCSWCIHDHTSLLSEPCCRGVDECQFGVVLSTRNDVCPVAKTTSTTPPPTSASASTSTSTSASSTTKETSDSAAIVGSVLGVVVILLLIVITVIVCHRIHIHKPDANYITAVPNYVQGNSDVGFASSSTGTFGENPQSTSYEAKENFQMSSHTNAPQNNHVTTQANGNSGSNNLFGNSSKPYSIPEELKL